MKVFNNVVSDNILNYLRALPETQPARLTKKQDSTTDARIYLNETDLIWDDIQNLIKQICPDCLHPERSSIAFERQTLPTALHVDPEPIVYTIIIPLHDDPDVRTIAWKEQFDTVKDFEQFITNMKPAKKKSSISKSELINHCFDKNKRINLADFLDFDGVFYYKSGDALVISGRQVHCSSDWRELKNYNYKDFAVIHTTP